MIFFSHLKESEFSSIEDSIKMHEKKMNDNTNKLILSISKLSHNLLDRNSKIETTCELSQETECEKTVIEVGALKTAEAVEELSSKLANIDLSETLQPLDIPSPDEGSHRNMCSALEEKHQSAQNLEVRSDSYFNSILNELATELSSTTSLYTEKEVSL